MLVWAVVSDSTEEAVAIVASREAAEPIVRKALGGSSV
jgi:hypothetical protein